MHTLNENKISLIGLTSWAVCAVFFTYEFLLRTVVGTFQHPIMLDLQLNAITFALLSTTAYLLIYSAMQVPVGLIADRLGVKKSVCIGIAICTLSTILFSFNNHFASAFLSRMLMGLGSSFGFICLLIAVYDWMPKKHFGFFIGASQFIGTLGPMIAAGPLDAIAIKGELSWRFVFAILGYTGILILLMALALVKNKSNNLDKFRIIPRQVPVMQNLKLVFKQKQAWLIALYSAMVYFTLEYFSENQGKTFLVINGYTETFSSYMISIGWLGYAIGCPLMGFLSDYTKKRKPMLVFAAICCLVSFITIVFFPISHGILIVAFFLLGIGTGGQGVGFAIMAEQCNKSYLATGLGLNNAVICLMGSLNAPIIGAIINANSDKITPDVATYQFAFSFVIAFIALSLIVSVFFIKETFCRPTKGFTVVKN